MTQARITQRMLFQAGQWALALYCVMAIAGCGGGNYRYKHIDYPDPNQELYGSF